MKRLLANRDVRIMLSTQYHQQHGFLTEYVGPIADGDGDEVL